MNGAGPNVSVGSFSEVNAPIGEVCFAPINGLRHSSLSGPLSAKFGNGSRRKVALHCEPTRSEAVMSRHIVLVPMS